MKIYYLDLGFYNRGVFVSHEAPKQVFTSKAKAINEARNTTLNKNEAVQILDVNLNVVHERVRI